MSFLSNPQCVLRPISQMFLPHLAIWAFLFFFFFDIVISNDFSSHGVFDN